MKTCKRSHFKTKLGYEMNWLTQTCLVLRDECPSTVTVRTESQVCLIITGEVHKIVHMVIHFLNLNSTLGNYSVSFSGAVDSANCSN